MTPKLEIVWQCAACGKIWKPSELEIRWTEARKFKPACSFKCAQALGQVKKETSHA